jgi:arsenite methyltransferase
MSAIKRLGLIIGDAYQDISLSDTQNQTKECFSFKWSRRDTYESEAVMRATKALLFKRYCNGDPGNLEKWMNGERKIILDAGCGAGLSALLFFGHHIKNHDYLGIDISDAISVAAKRFSEQGYSGDFIQCSISDLPVDDNSIDIIFSEGVLHHTDSTENAIKYLATKVKPGGRFMFYVYAKKAIIREFTDDHIRRQLASMTDEESWKALEPLTKLGIELGRLDCEIEVP